MFYEEKWIDGVLWCRSEPDGEWRRKIEPVAWLSTDCIGERFLCFSKPNDNDPVQPLYTEAQLQAAVQQEREAWRKACKEIIDRWVKPGELYSNAMQMLDLAYAAAIRKDEK